MELVLAKIPRNGQCTGYTPLENEEFQYWNKQP